MPDAALVARYQTQLLQLLPPGRAMTKEPSSSIAEYADAFAVEFARLHERADDMYDECYPGTATELLDEWEALCSLPGACDSATDLASRRAAILSRFVIDLGQSEQDFISLSDTNGQLNSGMSLYRTSRCGVMRCGQTPLHSDPWLFASRFNYEKEAAEEYQGRFRYQTSLVDPPGNNDVLFDSTFPNLVTEIRIDKDSTNKGDLAAMFDALLDDDWLLFFRTSTAHWVKYQIKGTPVDEGGWYTINVDNVSFAVGFTFPGATQFLDLAMFTNASRISDLRLECKLEAHAHIHTHFNFGGWDASSLARNLDSLRHHFVAGDFVTHTVGSFEVIDSWTNRDTGDDWTQFLADNATPFETQVDGWKSCDTGLNTIAKLMDGLANGAASSNANLIKDGDFLLFVAFYLDVNYDGTDTNLIQGTGFKLQVISNSLGNRVELDYDGATPNVAVTAGRSNVVGIWVDGTSGRIKSNGLTSNSFALGGSPTASTLYLGGGSRTAILEIIGANATDGELGVDAGVDEVYDYLVAKYGWT